MARLTTFVVLLAVAAGVLSLDVSNLPDCAQPCAVNAATLVKCKITDIECLCASTTFIQSVATCAGMGGMCNLNEQSDTIGILGAICPDQPDPTPVSSLPHSSITTTTSSTSSTDASTTQTSVSTTVRSTSKQSSTASTTTSVHPPTVVPLPTGVQTTIGGGLSTIPSLTRSTPSPSSTVIVFATVTSQNPQTTPNAASRQRVSGGWLVGAFGAALYVL